MSVLKIEKFERTGEITKREVITNFVEEITTLVRGNTYVSIPTLIKKERITLEIAEEEKVIYYEVFHGNKLQERYLDSEYRRTTPEYAHEFENFCKFGVQGLTF